MRAYEPVEFVSGLAANQLGEPVDLTLFGLVKADENERSIVLFSISSACEQWVPIPVSFITSIQHIRNVSCKDHQHPLVRIVLAEPKKEDASAVLFMRLFAQAKAAAAARRKAANGNPLRMTQGCEIIEFDDVPYACCPGDGGSWDCVIAI